MHSFIPLLVHYHGFKVSEIQVQHDPRKYRNFKYPIFRYQGLFDLISILFIDKYCLSMLYFFCVVGLMFMIYGMMVIAYFSIFSFFLV